MRQEIQGFLNQRPDLKYIVRENPNWYRTLSRNPFAIAILEENSKEFYGKTFGHQLDRWNQQLSSVSSLLSLLGDTSQSVPK